MTHDEFVDLQPSDEISLIGNDGRLRNRVVRKLPDGSVLCDQCGYTLVVEIGNCEHLERSKAPRNNQARKQPPTKAVSLHPAGKIVTVRR